jgi:predicted transcriptional regulator
MAAIRNPVNAERICALITEGYTLRQIASELGCTSGAIAIWAGEDEAFAKRYARAMDLRTDRMAEEILDIADDGSNDWVEREQDGRTVTVADHEHIQRSKLRVDARKWLMAKMLPKKYGDRTTIAGDPENPVAVADVTAERERKAAEAKALLDAAFGPRADSDG